MRAKRWTSARALLLPVALGVLPLLACGGGDGPADIGGSWFLVPSSAGVEEDPIHVTAVQAGTAVTFEVTCNAEWPLGHGTWAGGVLSVTFDLGGGQALSLEGASEGDDLVGTYTMGSSSGTWRMGRTGVALDCAHSCDPVTPVRFVSADFTELAKIEEISLFRSSAGHDFSDACEECRSMKHYYAPKPAFLGNGLVAVRSPVDGTVISVADEGHGASPPGENKQVRIRSDLHPEYTFVLFHVDLFDATVVTGRSVTAGEQVGWARLWYPDLAEIAHDFDVAVRLSTDYGERYVSFFDVMTDALFATYQARGAATRADFILPQATRDADPLTCSGQTFTSTGVLPAWFVLVP
jgi:hypothetical protein